MILCNCHCVEPNGGSFNCCITRSLLLNQAVAAISPFFMASITSTGASSRFMYFETKPFDFPILDAITSNSESSFYFKTR